MILASGVATPQRPYRKAKIFDLLAAAAVIAAYFLSGKLGLQFAVVNPSATAIWAPSGISLAACLLYGSWLWPAVFAGAFLLNATIYGSLATSVFIATGNTIEALVAVHLTRRLAHGLDVFNHTADTFRFVLFAAALSTMISATVGVTTLCAGGYASWSRYAGIWLTWWLGDAIGILIVTPLLLLWAQNPRLGSERRTIEAGLLVLAVLLTGSVIGGLVPFWGPPRPNAFLSVPLLLWAAFRFGPRDTATAVFLLLTAALAGRFGHPGTVGGGQGPPLLLIQMAVAVVGSSYLIVAIEVAERRRLDKSRSRLVAVVESSEDAIVAITPDARITEWNRGAERMYGFTAAEALGQPVSLIVPPHLTGESAEALARVKRGETIAYFETVRMRKDGTWLDVSLAISPIKDTHGRVIGFSKSARDITRRKAAQQEREALLRSEHAAREAAESANRAKDEFLAMLGHELRNPLHAILLASRLLDSPGSLDKGRGIIARQVEHISRLLDDLLDAARVTSGKIALSRRPLELSGLVSECIDVLRETGQLARHSVETELETVWVDGDFARLSQIVVNLLGNATKYTPPGGKIRVEVKAGEEAVIQVQDEGAGISTDILPRVFDLFARGEFGLQRSPAGLGIGLTLVKRIAELHGGRVQAASDGPGRGSIFTVTLPRVAPPPAYSAEAPQKPPLAGAPRRILVIEDNDDAREGFCLLLEAFGYEVHAAMDGASGVQKALEVRPDVVLIDLGLPEMDGYQVATRIRAEPACSATLLIALTGYGQSEYRAKAEAAGFSAFVTKPVDADTLEHIIAQAAVPNEDSGSR